MHHVGAAGFKRLIYHQRHVKVIQFQFVSETWQRDAWLQRRPQKVFQDILMSSSYFIRKYPNLFKPLTIFTKADCVVLLQFCHGINDTDVNVHLCHNFLLAISQVFTLHSTDIDNRVHAKHNHWSYIKVSTAVMMNIQICRLTRRWSQQVSLHLQYCIVVGSRRLVPPDALQPKAYCTNPGL